MPFYPVLPAVAFLGSLVVFLGLDIQAKLYSGVWFLIGCAIYFLYGMRHSALTKGSEVEKETEALEQAKSDE